MRALFVFLLFASPLAAQSYVPTCLSAAEQASIVSTSAADAPLLGIDLTDVKMRWADSYCAQQSLTLGALKDIATLKAEVAALTPVTPPTPPTPTCATTSGSTIPSSTCLQDTSGNTWTLGGVNPLNTTGGNLILVNGTALPGTTAGVLLLLYQPVGGTLSIYTQSQGGSWYQWSGTQFNNVAKDPRT